MKKFVVCILTIAMVYSLMIHASAEQHEHVSYSFNNRNVEVIFDEDTPFTEEQQQRIAEILVNNTPPIESRAWCWLLGHEYISDAVSVITHEVYDTNPRCIKQYYEVTTCANCNYYDEELIGTIYLDCCPA